MERVVRVFGMAVSVLACLLLFGLAGASDTGAELAALLPRAFLYVFMFIAGAYLADTRD